MRISMIGCKGIPASTAKGGGIETHVEELATRLVQQGHLVTVYVRPYANPNKRSEFRGVKLITLPTIHRKNIDAIVHTFLASLHVLFCRADIVHYHGVGPSTLAWIPRVFKPWSKVIVTFHSRDRFHGKWSWFAKKYLSFGEWTSMAFPHATIAVSHSIQLFCKKRFHKRCWHIPNGVTIPTTHVASDRLRAWNLKSNEYFFTLSRLVPHKAIEDAILAFSNIETQKKLVIIGSAAFDDALYESRLRHQAANDPRVVFVGNQTGEDLVQLIGNGYAMIHPSRSEGLSVAVLEAMSYGKMVIMSDIPENLEMIDHSGISFKVGDVRALHEAIQWAIDDPEMVDDRGTRARTHVQTHYSWESVVERTIALYRTLQGRSTS